MPKPDDAGKPEGRGQGLAGKTRTLTADVGDLKAGDQVEIVSQDGNQRTVKPVGGGDDAQVTVSANQLQGGNGDDEPEPPAEGVTVQSGP